ncbi:MAG: 2-hydroxycarboxylate transporter family protein [Puniceicoccales bacterium]
MKTVQISGVPLVPYCVAASIILIASILGLMPSGLIGAFAFLIALGALLAFLGDHTPILKDYLGGAPLLCIFGSAAMVYWGGLPTAIEENVSEFMRGGGFLNFYIAGLISGSILGMDPLILKRAGLRYVFPLVGGVLCAMVVTSLLGFLLFYGWKDTAMFVCFPIIGGGMGAGAVPMSEIVSSVHPEMDAGTALSRFVPALALGNVFAIVTAGLLDKLGKRFPRLTGNGVLMQGFEPEKKKSAKYTVENLGMGLFFACVFYVAGQLLEYFIPAVHSYALMILLVATIKLTNCVPPAIQEACHGWYKFVVSNFTPALLVGIGIAYTDLNEVMQTMSPTFVLLVATAVISIVIASGYIGTKVGFYFVEAALTSGLGMADMGGTGDVAVLSAARRMELMPFMQISSRLGGAMILMMVGIFAPILL